MDENKEKFREDDFIMRINNNIMALNTHRQLGINNSAAAKALEKLSSGYRINRAGDDAAGLSISEKMRGQIRGLNMASKNSQDGISLIQTAEGALNETHAILQRMRELAVQSASDTNTSVDRDSIQKEIDQLNSEIDRIANTTEFNTKKLIDGSMGKAVATAVKNVQTNTSISNMANANALLTALKDSAGNSLGIADGDVITINYVVNGTLATKNVTVDAANTKVSDLADTGYTVTVPSLNNLVFTAAADGFTGAVYGISITVKDSAGNVKTAATNALSAFKETTAAADVRLDGRSTFQIGANEGQTMVLDIENMKAAALGVSSLKVGTQSQASIAVKVVDGAIAKVSAERSKLGAVQNRLEHTIKNLDTAAENLQASESRIRDVDMAKEMMNFTKQNILIQASTAMLAQANQAPQAVLQLLR
jgi:flagellin